MGQDREGETESRRGVTGALGPEMPLDSSEAALPLPPEAALLRTGGAGRRPSPHGLREGLPFTLCPPGPLPLTVTVPIVRHLPTSPKIVGTPTLFLLQG